MIIYYAMGGGLGHLVRARAVAHTLDLERETTVLTASPHADDRRVTGPLRVKSVPAQLERHQPAWAAWLARTIEELRPRAFFVDAFPEGILGELALIPFPAGTQLHHVARRLRPACLPNLFASGHPRFDTCYVVEDLAPEHRDLLEARARALVTLSIRDPSVEESSDARQICASIQSRHKRFWLVVHSGPADEVRELLGFAAELRAVEAAQVEFVLITSHPVDDAPEHTFRYDLYPASLLFSRAQRIISGGGFNIMRQAAAWRSIHTVLPFERRADDQYWRATHRRQPTPATDSSP